MAVVFANILPDEEYAAKRTGVNPDVTSDMTCYKAVERVIFPVLVLKGKV